MQVKSFHHFDLSVDTESGVRSRTKSVHRAVITLRVRLFLLACSKIAGDSQYKCGTFDVCSVQCDFCSFLLSSHLSCTAWCHNHSWCSVKSHSGLSQHFSLAPVRNSAPCMGFQLPCGQKWWECSVRAANHYAFGVMITLFEP